MHRSPNVRILLAFLFAATMLSGCGRFGSDSQQTSSAADLGMAAEEPSGPAAQPAGVLRLAHDLGWGGTESVDPASASPFSDVMMLVYDGLVTLDENNRVVGSLASSWTYSDDATEWTFELEPDVLFHDGSPFTPEDVIFTFERILEAGSDSPISSVLQTLVSVEVAGSQSVVFALSAPAVDFDLLLADRRMRIVSSQSGPGVGTGPFQIEHYDPKNTSRFVAFEDYWQGVPKLAAVETIAIPSGAARLEAIASGAIDILGSLTPAEVVAFERHPDFAVDSVASGDWRGIVFRTDVAPFDDVRVRQALRLVADRDEMVRVVAGGPSGATVACDSPVWSMDQYHQELECPPDVEVAKRLLAEAGYPDGLSIEITTSTLDPYWLPMLELYRFQAALAGIDVEIVVAPAESYWSDVWMVEPAVTTEWAERNAQQVLTEAFVGGATWNETYWESDAFDGLVADASATLGVEQRRALYHQAQDLIRSDGGAFIPFHINRQRVVSQSVTGMVPTGRFRVPWHEVAVSR